MEKTQTPVEGLFEIASKLPDQLKDNLVLVAKGMQIANDLNTKEEKK